MMMMMMIIIIIIIISYLREVIKLLDDWVNDIFSPEKHPFLIFFGGDEKYAFIY